jgi:hypothetical protein
MACVLSQFSLEHTFRFVKERLGWTTPRVRHPEQADPWTWLVLVAYAQLRLARRVVEDHRLPGTPLPEGSFDAVESLTGVFATAGEFGHPGRAAKTLRPFSRPSKRGTLGSGQTVPCPEEGRPTA